MSKRSVGFLTLWCCFLPPSLCSLTGTQSLQAQADGTWIRKGQRPNNPHPLTQHPFGCHLLLYSVWPSRTKQGWEHVTTNCEEREVYFRPGFIASTLLSKKLKVTHNWTTWTTPWCHRSHPGRLPLTFCEGRSGGTPRKLKLIVFSDCTLFTNKSTTPIMLPTFQEDAGHACSN